MKNNSKKTEEKNVIYIQTYLRRKVSLKFFIHEYTVDANLEFNFAYV